MGVGKGGQGGPRSLLDIEILSIKSCFLYFEWDNNKFHHFWPPGKILEKSPSGPPGKIPSTPMCTTGADPASKGRGGDFSNSW